MASRFPAVIEDEARRLCPEEEGTVTHGVGGLARSGLLGA
jgi:hypothetical protein